MVSSTMGLARNGLASMSRRASGACALSRSTVPVLAAHVTLLCSEHQSFARFAPYRSVFSKARIGPPGAVKFALRDKGLPNKDWCAPVLDAMRRDLFTAGDDADTKLRTGMRFMFEYYNSLPSHHWAEQKQEMNADRAAAKISAWTEIRGVRKLIHAKHRGFQ